MMGQSRGLRVSLQGYIFAVGIFLGVVILSLLGAGIAMAQQSSSTSYQVNEVFFGTGGELNACSTSYCSKQSAGETAVGNAASTSYQAQAGFNTDRQEYLEFSVTNSSTDLGVLSVGSTASATGSFSVKTYLASGYVVTNASDPPRSGSNFLANLISPTASAIGTEQFGINLKDNATPNIGTEAVQVPDSSFSFGVAATGYNVADQYKYVKGDTIASSLKSSGQTTYTVSYIYNISNSTKSGQYNFIHNMVATSTF